jgi:hypothetical protein
MLTADALAEAFGTGRPTGPPVQHQHTSFPTWRLDTTSGAYLVKRLWVEDPDWRPHVERAMAFERGVLAAGVPTARPVPPVHPAFGYAARLPGHGVFRAYEWLDHRPLAESDDVAEWLGRVLARLHSLEAAPPGSEPGWRWLGIFPRAAWDEWTVLGAERGKPWAPVLRRHLDSIMRLADRLVHAYSAAGDLVLTHGDVEPYNVLITEDGPVLIDWESVGHESATLETGRAAVAFGRGDPDLTARFLHAYRDAGGTLADLGDDLLIRPVALDLCHIAERITAVLGQEPAPGWLDLRTADRRIGEQVTELPEKVARLEALAEAVRAR